MPRIFISYRRSDSADIVGRIYDVLVSAFGKENVFKDVDNISIGTDFRAAIESQLITCDVMLVVIGPDWLDTADSAGNRRLDNPSDPVRIEIEMGLRHKNVRVVPTLVNNATMPPATSLVPSLYSLVYLNAAIIRNDPDFKHDTERFIRALSPKSSVFQRNRRLLFLTFLLILIASVLVFFAVRNRSGWDTTQTSTPEPATAVIFLLTNQAISKLTENAPTYTATPNLTKTLDWLVTAYFITQTSDVAKAIAAYTATPTATFTPSLTSSPTADRNGTATSKSLTQTAFDEATLTQVVLNLEKTGFVKQTLNAQSTTDAQATANVPTNTPPPTLIPTAIPTPTSTSTPTQTLTLTPTLSPTPTVNLTSTSNAGATGTQIYINNATQSIQTAQAQINAQTTVDSTLSVTSTSTNSRFLRQSEL